MSTMKRSKLKEGKVRDVTEHPASGSTSARACTRIDERRVHTHTILHAPKKNVVAPKNKKNNDVMCILILVCRTL